MQTSVIYNGDNLQKLPELDKESVDLVYIDPPFNSGRTYEVIWREAEERRSFEDRFGDLDKYTNWLRPRLHQLVRVLKPTGSIYVHCDPHANYRIRTLLQDELKLYFRSEIVWKRSSAHSDGKQGRRQHGRVHDTIYFFSKSEKWTWNRMFTPYDEDYVRDFYKHVEESSGRRFRLSDMTGPGGTAKGSPEYEVMGVVRAWRYKRELMQRKIDEGRVIQTKPGAVPQEKRYLDEMPGVPLQDLWTDIKPLSAQNRERIGYPTQKPVTLLKRIIESSSNPGDLVLDAFCGCGTSVVAAAALDRKWIGIDQSPTACRVMADRLFRDLKMREGVHFLVRTTETDEVVLKSMDPWDFQNWAVNALGGVPNFRKGADKGIDGRLYIANPNVPTELQKKIVFGSLSGRAQTQKDMFADSIPVQVKQKEKAGRQDIDQFQTAMRRDKKTFGIFVAFGYSADAEDEIKRAKCEEGLTILHLKVSELLEVRRAA